MASPTGTRVRLAELIAMISLGTDLGMGQPMEHVMRQSLIALRLAERLGLDDESRAVVYYVGLIAWVGCHVDAYEQAKWFGDDQALKNEARHVDMTGVAARAFILSHVGAGRGLVERARLGVEFVGDGRRAASEMIANHWAATNELAARLGLDDKVRESLYQTFERWDGKGVPGEAKVEGLAGTGRVINAAAAVMVVVFMTFAIAGPLPPKEMGFILAVAVLLDATLVRLLLQPVILRLLGRRAWWMPAWLDRVLPEVRLSHELPEAKPEKRAAAAARAALPETPSFT